MQKLWKALSREPEGVIGVIFLGIMCLLVFLQVLFRYVIQLPLYWTEELARYLFIWVIYLGAVLCIPWNRHLRLEIAINLFPDKFRGYIRKVGNVLFIVFAVILLVRSVGVLNYIISSHQVSPAVRLPMQYVYVSVPVCCVLMIVRLVQVLIKGYRKAGPI